MRFLRFASSALLIVLALATPLFAQPVVPTTGADILGRMRSAFGGRWYSTLTFVQKTTLRRPDGGDTVQTWYESIRYTPARGTVLRIDVAPLSGGNGSLSTWDSTYTVRGGTLASTRPTGNPFLPFIESVYLQPVERTVREMAPLKIDLSKVRTDRWEGRRAWVVGAAAGDSVSPQFWVDDERQVVVRMIVESGAGRPPLDIHLLGYVRVGEGWLATKIEMYSGGARRQGEDYSDWKAGMPLAAELFEAGAWRSAAHWAKGYDK